MAIDPVSPLTAPASRAEKMSILSAMLGPDALARLREGQSDGPSKTSPAPVEVDADRAAWHRNKLLERLRDQGRMPSGSNRQVNTPAATEAPPRDPVPNVQRASGRSLDMRLAAIAEFETLAYEHPAIITRLVRGLSRDERISVIKSLPGPLARSVVKRLR